MNEQLVSWFEELLPDIKESGDVEGVMLKFANEKNLAPALLEKLGHVYNTAKTVTYLDKCASADKSRANTFNVLDVPSLLETYTAKKASSNYSDANFSSLSSGRFTDLSKDILNFEDFKSLDNPEDYTEVKIASDRRAEQSTESVKFANAQQAEQIAFDASEDNRKIASEISDYVRDSYNEKSFTDVERDSNYYFGDCVKSACDLVANYMGGIGYSVERAESGGKPRLIEDTTFIQKIATIQYNLNNIENAQAFIADNTKKKQASNLDFVAANRGISPESLQDAKDFRALDKHKKKTIQEAERLDKQVQDRANAEEKERQERATREVPGDHGSADHSLLSESSDALIDSAISGSSNFYNELDVKDKTLAALGMKGKSLPDMLRSTGETAKDFLGMIRSDTDNDQKLIDRELDEAKYVSIIQDLVITDPILGEEDEDKVIDLYNTIKSVAPEMAKDKNVVRVVLRSAVQYDGIAAPDLAQLVEAERSLQKSRMNNEILDSVKYDRGTDVGNRLT